MKTRDTYVSTTLLGKQSLNLPFLLFYYLVHVHVVKVQNNFLNHLLLYSKLIIIIYLSSNNIHFIYI